MTQFNESLLDYISTSPTPMHAVKNACLMLDAQGFTALEESQPWVLKTGGRYYVTRRDSSLIAFTLGQKPVSEAGFRILGAHTDSPCLKVKPEPDITAKGYHQVGIDVYGGVLLAPWFDRDLSLAGRVSVESAKGGLQHHLIDFKRPIAFIPSLAIHLDRTANIDKSINPQEHMPPILWQTEGGSPDKNFRSWLQNYMQAQGLDVANVLDFDLSFYDAQPGAVIGVNNEFIACARLDNLLSCFVALKSLIFSENQTASNISDQNAPSMPSSGHGAATRIVVLNDHEEVGSRSSVGAAGNFLQTVLERIEANLEQRHQAINRSMMMSVDNAHGIHPNFAAKHDGNHAPLVNKGPVLKFDANQSYATQSAMSALIRVLAKQVDVPLQTFVTRADMRCGSTIGPITATNTGIETLDIGVPTFGMHSIRELAGTKDSEYLLALLTEFLDCALP